MLEIILIILMFLCGNDALGLSLCGCNAIEIKSQISLAFIKFTNDNCSQLMNDYNLDLILTVK